MSESMIDTCERLVDLQEIQEHGYNIGFFNANYMNENEDGEPLHLWMSYRHHEDVVLYITKKNPDKVVIKSECIDEDASGGPVMAVFSPEEFLYIKQFGTFTTIRWKKVHGGKWRQPKNAKA